jgi:hypothetical protein
MKKTENLDYDYRDLCSGLSERPGTLAEFTFSNKLGSNTADIPRQDNSAVSHTTSTSYVHRTFDSPAFFG